TGDMITGKCCHCYSCLLGERCKDACVRGRREDGARTLSVLQEQPRRDASEGLASSPSSCSLLDAASSASPCPSTPGGVHSKLASCPSPVATLKRPTALSRHASAAGFSLQAAGTWAFGKGHGRSPAAQSPTLESAEGAAIEVEDIPALLRDVARFAEAVEKLKEAVVGEDKQESRRQVAHEILGEVLRNLRQIINTYPLLNTVETLTAAGTLISKVKGFHYEGSSESDRKDFEKAIESIAVAFSSSVSELLMGEVDSSTLLALPPTEKSRVSTPGQNDRASAWSVAEEVDVILQRSEGGVDSALTYAKSFSKYLKDVISYVEKRVALEVEFAKGLQRLYHSCKQSLTQPHMPFFSIFSLALEQDHEQSTGMLQTTIIQHSQTFLQPLMQRKQEHEKRRKEIKEQWQRARRKLMEAETNLRKAKQGYVVRCEEYDKARAVASKAEEEQGGSSGGGSAKTLDKKRRLEEEARNKAEEAEATYRTCIADATTQHQELEDVKVNVLRQIQELIKQSDQILRSTISYYQIMHVQTAVLPVHYQTLCESSKLYEPGQQYGAHVKELQMAAEPEVHYAFEAYSPPCALAPPAGRTHQFHKSWPSTVSDTDSVAPCDISKMPRTSSTGTMSSTEELSEKDGSVVTFERSMNGIEPEIAVPTGPFRNVGLSKAAQTHRLRKLRTPSKCRECDSYVYFQGAECEECFLACHKKCLESLAIQCGHKKLQGRLQLFGREFSQASAGAPNGVPFIVTKCILEIERRALKMKGIYRVNGVKTRVEKLCQAFENGKELVELSQASPHDISNVLKLYLRQLPEPIVPFRMYNDLMGAAKESLRGEGENGEVGKGPELVDLGEATEPEVLALVSRLRELLKELPRANVATLKYIVRHLCRIAELEQDNKMSPNNLGIVFGPTLMRPRPTGATVSLSSLVDYPHQARIVEALIVFYRHIFRCGEGSSQRDSQVSPTPTCTAVPERNSLGSSGSRERSLGSDSDLEDTGAGPRDSPSRLAKQESETSTEDDLLSPRTSLDLSDPPQPRPPSTEPPLDPEVREEEQVSSSQEELGTTLDPSTP
uniref:Rho GTPase activating protein 45 n=1 Tax=Scleropages formosus TaxID=113540 RepID=A0A8C9TEA9_SCLFO